MCPPLKMYCDNNYFSSLHCLFCSRVISGYRKLDAKTTRKKLSKAMDLIFRKLCLSLDLKENSCFNWDFGKEVQFCKSCRIEVVRLCRLQDQKNLIQKEMLTIVATLSAITIESNLKSRDGPWSRRRTVAITAEESFRNAIIKRYSAKVILKDCSSQESSLEVGSRTLEEATDLDLGIHQNHKAREVKNLPELQNLEDLNNSGTEMCSGDFGLSGDGIDFECTTLSDTEPEKDTTHLEESCGLQSDKSTEINTDSCDVFLMGKRKELRLELEGISCSDGTLPVLNCEGNERNSPDTNRESVPATKLSSQEARENQSVCSEISKPMPQSSFCGTKDAEDVREQCGKAEWIRGNQYTYQGIEFTVDKNAGACLECDYKTEGEAVYCYMEVHIRNMHFPEKKSCNEIELIDKMTKTYTLGAFKFKEVASGYQCLTCDKIFPKYSTRGEYREERFRSIRSHIQVGHMGTGMCSICKELKQNLRHHMASLHPKEYKLQSCVSSQNECEKNAVCSGPGTLPNMSQTSSSRRKRKSRFANVRGPNGKVEWVEGNQYTYHGFRFTADEDKVSCSECSYQAVPGKDFYCGIKMHIRRHVAAKKTASSEDFSCRKIKLIDETTKTYTIGGFEFTEAGKNHYRCSMCNQLLTRSWKKDKLKFTNIRNHIEVVHMEIRSGTCSICNEHKKDLPMHMENVHSQKTNTRVCETCGKEFKNRRLLNNHQQTHKDPSEFKNQCDRCGKKFRSKEQLNCHMRTHTGEKPYICEKCGRRFAFQTVYQTHLAGHAKIRPFACIQCEWTFGAKFLLTRHIKQVHEGIKPPPAKKRKIVVPDDDETSSSSSSTE